MAYVLRLIQHYKPAYRQGFLDLEAKFRSLERRLPNFPRARRSQPIAGGEPTHSLIWECEFASLADVQSALTELANDPTHTELFNEQSPYITQIRTEIFEILEL